MPIAKKLKDRRFQWLDELGAVELASLRTEELGFLFRYQYGPEELRKQVGDMTKAYTERMPSTSK